jgi:adenylate cyclase
MNYLTKLYICFIGLIFFTTTITTGFIYYENRVFLFNELKSKVLSIASTIAALLDPTAIKEIKSPQDTESKSFEALKNELILASNINKRSDLYLLYAYLLRPSNDGSTKIDFIIDSTSDPKAAVLPGQKYFGGDALFYHLRNYYVPNDFIKNNWGTVLSAYAPVYDKEGNYVATLGVDVKATDISDKLLGLLFLGLVTFCITAAISLIIAFAFSKIISNNLHKIQKDVCRIGEGDLDHKIVIDTEDEFNELACSINHMTEGLKEREKIKVNFAKYVSKQVLEKILCGKGEIKLSGERKKVTLLFSDIPKFTKVAENMEPENVVSLLNEYFSEMLDVIVEFDGTIDKFIGEGIMVEFGVPIADYNQEVKAVKAAIKMQSSLEELLSKWTGENRPHIDMCIGIHTGDAIVGNIGSDKRMEYTAIGDTVNIASRLVKLAKEKKLKILISEQVYEKIKDEYNTSSLGEVYLTGKTVKTTVYAIDSNKGK